MNVIFTFRHMESSAELKTHTTAKLERLTRFEEREMVVNVTFSIEKFHKCVELQASGDHGVFVSKETRDEMYEAIDLAIDKLDRQLAREKSKRKHHKGLPAMHTHEIHYKPSS